MLEGPLHDEHSVTYGISEKSVLNEIEHFHVANQSCLPQYLMHLLLEGVAPIELKLLLKAFVREKVFSLETLNERIHEFDYGYHDNKDKPSEIKSAAIHGEGRSIRMVSYAKTDYAQSGILLWSGSI